MKDLEFYFSLIFRIVFYSYFLSILFFEKSRNTCQKNKNIVNIVILFFACCYIGYFSQNFFSGKNYDFEMIKFVIVILSCFYSYLLIFNNKLQFYKSATFLHYSSNLSNNTVITIITMFILACNTFFNVHSYRGTWHGDFISEIFHGLLCILFPIFFILFNSINTKGKLLGNTLLIFTPIQFFIGISFSYGTEGFLSDDLDFSVIFILNTIIFFYAGLHHSNTKT